MTLEDVLDQCIRKMEQGARINDLLEQHPAHAVELAPLLGMVAVCHRLRVTLSEEDKARIWARVRMVREMRQCQQQG